jgi:2-methylcitrate dehydratase
MPEQYAPERIRRADVQALLQRVTVRPNTTFSRRFPEAMPCRLKVVLRDGRSLAREQEDYEGFHTRPMTWDRAREKFDRLSASHAAADLRGEIAEAVLHLEDLATGDLTVLLSRVPRAG